MTNSVLSACNSILQGNACTERCPEICLYVVGFRSRLGCFHALSGAPFTVVLCPHLMFLLFSGFHIYCAKCTRFIVTGCSRVFKRFLQSVLIKCSQMFRFVSQRKNAFLKMRQKTGKNRPLQMLNSQQLILLHNSRARKLHGCCETVLQSKSHAKQAGVCVCCTTEKIATKKTAKKDAV